ncbi:MAG TPA: family 10 glycosylhydrolase, partial [Candidatus Sericytochromatia bacterium]
MLKQAKNYILKFCAKRLAFGKSAGKYRKNILLLCVLLLAIAVIIPTSSYSQTNLKNTPELRGVWLTNVDSDVLFSRNKLTAAVQNLQQLNFNTVYPTVWNEGYTLYPSTVAERTFGRSLHPEPGLQGRDM